MYRAGNQVLPAGWITYYTGHPYRRLDTPRGIRRAAQQDPRADVLLRCGHETRWLVRACGGFGLRVGEYRAVPIGSLERAIGA